MTQDNDFGGRNIQVPYDHMRKISEALAQGSDGGSVATQDLIKKIKLANKLSMSLLDVKCSQRDCKRAKQMLDILSEDPECVTLVQIAEGLRPKVSKINEGIVQAIAQLKIERYRELFRELGSPQPLSNECEEKVHELVRVVGSKVDVINEALREVSAKLELADKLFRALLDVKCSQRDCKRAKQMLDILSEDPECVTLVQIAEGLRPKVSKINEGIVQAIAQLKIERYRELFRELGSPQPLSNECEEKVHELVRVVGGLNAVGKDVDRIIANKFAGQYTRFEQMKEYITQIASVVADISNGLDRNRELPRINLDEFDWIQQCAPEIQEDLRKFVELLGNYDETLGIFRRMQQGLYD